ncbi:hypothetical protein NM208_g4668 [Fusarium decemcellulare]|uniref:Uncharacterized protein n=1 Tax=Fusarium decemcellulare TaxID=57161 RepID=A0ACC1SK51_9HYPO|nr:hypothetical protein NM208_g4668 [Fusarium decemcellulare]
MAQVAPDHKGPELAVEAHVKYIQSLDTRKDELDYWLTEHLRLNGLYWGLNALYLLNRPNALPRQEVIDFVLSCQHDNGGFGAAPGHDAHMLSTVSAVQILAMTDAFDQLEAKGKGKSQVGKFIAGLQNRETGTFAGDEWGEEDTRFLYGAFNALSLLGLMSLVDVDKAVAHIIACANFDGGYGTGPGAESHSGQIFTCVAALAIVCRLDLVDKEKLGRWLSERQVPGGGLNGRPEKQEDVCYSWWVLSSLAMIDRTHWIDRDALIAFILKSQDTEIGGISDRPGDMVDVWHTQFGLCGLSLLGYPGLEAVDPVDLADSSAISFFDRQKHCHSEVEPLQVEIADQAIDYEGPPLPRLNKTNKTQQASQKLPLRYLSTNLGHETGLGSVHIEQTWLSRLINLAPAMSAANNVVNSANRQIPLLCTVCPEVPRFSDVSHLLTHIASKGHLHHETQTKLKAHQDIAASVALRRYEDYPSIKIEQDDLIADFPIFPGYFGSEQEVEGRDDLVTGADSLSLKGQIWPGMSKMDLANDEMKRTRNQRKPKSVIERMKRASEGVVPNQVIMTPDFKVERVKDVYDDSSSPIPGQEQSTPPRKAPKPKRKKPAPLAEISANVSKPRRSNTRGLRSNAGKRAQVKPEFEDQEDLDRGLSPFNFRQGHDVFRDDDGHSNSFGGQILPSSRNDRRFDLRGRHSTRSISSTPHSNLVSPTPHPRDLTPRHFTTREGTSSLRPDSFPPGSFSHIEASYAMKDATIYNASSRLPFTSATHNQFHGVSQDHFRLASNNTFQLKQDDYSGSIAGDSTQGTTESPFAGMPSTNPFFSQDRLFLNSFNQGTPNTTLPTLSFSPVNRQRERSHGTREVKPQTHLCEVMDSNDLCDGKDSGLSGSWSLHPSNHELDFPDELATEDPQI